MADVSALSEHHVWEFVHYDDNTWRWRKLTANTDSVLLESARVFNHLQECLGDAEQNGFGATPQ